MFTRLSELGPGILIEGGAGAGKTHYLSSQLESMADELRMEAHQVIPVMSAMHGARRRLAARLQAVEQACKRKSLYFSVSVTTIDAFLMALVHRLNRSSPQDGAPDFDSGDFEPCHRFVQDALRDRAISALCRNTFPLIVVDEFQDCRGTKLDALIALSDHVPVIAAADDFQVLENTADCPAIAWATKRLKRIPLGNASRRTSQTEIVNSAQALRENVTCVGDPVACVFTPAPALAAWQVMDFCRQNNTGNTAVLAFSTRKPFAAKTFDALRQARDKTSRMRPLHIRRVIAENDEVAAIKRRLADLPTILDTYAQPGAYGLTAADYSAFRSCAFRARRQNEAVTRDALIAQLKREAHFRRAFGVGTARRVMLSIHGAKNQEWDNVVVLWSNRVFPSGSDAEYKRRLLYNAITRARSKCLVVIEGTAKEWDGDALLALLRYPTPDQLAPPPKKRKRRAR